MITEDLYFGLYGHAKIIVSSLVKGRPPEDIKDLSHDITVDFLFFSQCFKAFQPEKGDLKSLFLSYARKRVWSGQRMFGDYRMLGLDERICYDEKFSSFPMKLEAKDALISLYRDVGCKSSFAQSVLGYFLKETLENGSCSVRRLCSAMGNVSRRKILRALELLRREYHVRC
jgi:hypothetical protein